MKSSLYKISRWKHYKKIKTCLLVEDLLLVNGHVPKDIKLHCFNRQDEMNIFIQVDYDHFGASLRDIFDENWQRTSIMTSLAKQIVKAIQC
ncbi:ATP-grasp fold amidoligase family protein [Sodalis-like endosymbiont of Proechinophthirus fluctus]|uniref:ATP-grasp fold amidoligase family protein n=1 Tax=Sodalis-like endosymbiont of Proechinophthirus fluctus TaxID=1462730 RepID=UPI000AA4A6E8|nr:ATP-grasp fold amidoligase family protein [Sodalis-like endosymbiont of Proechinophthirus fluctus]